MDSRPLAGTRVTHLSRASSALTSLTQEGVGRLIREFDELRVEMLVRTVTPKLGIKVRKKGRWGMSGWIKRVLIEKMELSKREMKVLSQSRVWKVMQEHKVLLISNQLHGKTKVCGPFTAQR